MKPYTEEYGSDEDERTPGEMMAGLIRRAHKMQFDRDTMTVGEYVVR